MTLDQLKHKADWIYIDELASQPQDALLLCGMLATKAASKVIGFSPQNVTGRLEKTVQALLALSVAIARSDG